MYKSRCSSVRRFRQLVSSAEGVLLSTPLHQFSLIIRKLSQPFGHEQHRLCCVICFSIMRICENSHRGLISPDHIDGKHNPADLGTKLLPAEVTEHYSRYVLDSASGPSL